MWVDTRHSLYGSLSINVSVTTEVGEDTVNKKLQGRKFNSLPSGYIPAKVSFKWTFDSYSNEAVATRDKTLVYPLASHNMVPET